MTDAQIVEDLRTHLDRLVARDAFSGTVLFAKEGQILFQQAYGFANHAFNAPNKVDTKLNLGSMGKMFTGVAILQLAQQGKLSLSDTVLKLVPDYPDQEIAGKITVYQLLTHTSGLGNFFGEKFAASSRAQYRTTESHLPLFAGEPLQFEPGGGWSYSNAGFVVLGLIIEHVSGESYYDYVREHIFEPAGMLDTDNFNVDDDVPNLALGYTRMGFDQRMHPDQPRHTNILMHVGRGGSAGGGYSTVGDLLRFSRALQEHKLLDEKHTDLDMTGQVATGRGKYGFGMAEEFINGGVRIVGHNGGFAGINGQLDMYPDLGYTVAVLSNFDDAAEPINERLRWTLTGGRVPEAVQVPAQALQLFVGKYALAAPPNAPPGMRAMPPMPPIEITADETSLCLNGRMRHRFLPLSAREFFDEDFPGDRLRFAKDARGRIIGLTVERAGLGPAMTAKRLP